MALSSSTDCGGNYTSPKGLTFSVLCDRDIPGLWDIDSTGAATAEECFALCSDYPNALCGAAVFEAGGNWCFFKDTNATASNSTEISGRTLGVASESQLRPLPLECTEQNANITTRNSLAFTVHCDQRAKGSDLCPLDEPECRIHADSIDECLEHCSTMHPLCTSVDWDARLHFGWLNCWPKNWTTREYDGNRIPTMWNVSTAKAWLEDIEDVCQSDPSRTETASSGDAFELLCEQDRPGNNITIRHASSLDMCVDLCARGNTTGCVEAVFDSKMVNGYENCYLKSATGVPLLNQDGFTIATRQNNSAPAPSTSETQQSLKRNIVWIAGPIVGGVAALAVTAVVIWWCWPSRAKTKTSKTKNVQIINLQEPWQKPELDLEPRRRTELDSEGPQALELDTGLLQRLELDQESSQRLELDQESRRRLELDATTTNVPTRNLSKVIGFRRTKRHELST